MQKPQNQIDRRKLLEAMREFVRLESAGGILLLGAAVAALIVANSPLQHLYSVLMDTPVVVQVGALAIDKPLLLWVNDGPDGDFLLSHRP